MKSLRTHALTLAGAALVVSACESAEKLTLPEQPIDRAATCGVVAAIDERSKITDIKAPLPIEAQEHILHYALLAASEGGSFSSEKATAVLKRMSDLEGDITEGKWQDLLPQCREAYHEAWTFNVELPKDRFDSKLQCDELGKFVTRALRTQESRYAERISAYDEMARKLDQRLGPGLRVRAGEDLGAQQEVRRKALAAAAKLGRPTPVLDLCLERYG